MRHLLLVGIGGFVGAISRFKLGGVILHHTEDWKFPVGTFIINVSGCLVAGILAGLAEKHDFFTQDTRLFLFTGILGGFTTFSAYGLETFYLFQRQEWTVATLNMILSLLCGISSLWLGVKFVS